MEHEFRSKLDAEDVNELLGVDHGVDSENDDFEAFLRNKVDSCSTDVIAEMNSLPISKLTKEQPTEKELHEMTQAEMLEKYPGLSKSQSVNAAEGIAPFARKLSEEERDALSSSAAVESVEEKQARLELRQRSVIGGGSVSEQYIVEVVEPASIDDEAKKVFIESIRIGSTQCTPEQIIQRINDLERSVFLFNIQARGLRVSLEEVLKATTHSERARLMDLDSKYRAAAKRKASGKKETKRKETVIKTSVKASAKTPAMKAADTLKNLSYTREAIETKLKASNLLDEATADYVSKLFT